MNKLNYVRLNDILFSALSAIAGGFLFLLILTNLPTFFDYMTNAGISGNPVNAPIFYKTLYVFAIILGLMSFKAGISYLNTPLVLWTFGYAAVILLNIWRVQVLNVSEAEVDVQWDALQRLSILPIVGYLCMCSPMWVVNRLIPIACLLICGGVIVDFLNPGVLSPTGTISIFGSGRADGFFLNANAGAEGVVLSLALTRSRINRNLFMVLYLICGVAVMCTFSRSGVMMWLLLGFLSAFSGHVNRLILVVPLLFLLALNIFTPQIQDYLESIPEYQGKTENMLSRLSFFTESVAQTEDVIEEDSRIQILQDGFIEAMKKPILGYGYSYRSDAENARPHNMILELFHLYGIAGLGVWLWMLFLLYKNTSNQPLLARFAPLIFLFFSFFSHNIFEYVFWFVFLSVSVYIDGTGAKQLTGTNHFKHLKNSPKSSLKGSFERRTSRKKKSSFNKNRTSGRRYRF